MRVPIQIDPLAAALRKCRKAIPRLTLFSAAINVLMLTAPLFMLQMYDRVLSSGHMQTLFALSAIAAIALLTLGALDMIRSQMLARLGQWLDRELAPEMISLSVQGALRGKAVDAQALTDLGAIRNFVSSPSITALLDGPWVPLYVVVLWILHPLLGTIGLIAIIFFMFIAIISELVSRTPFSHSSKLTIANQKEANTAVREAEVFHAMGVLPAFLKRWTKNNDEAGEHRVKALDRGATISGFTKFLRMLVQIGVLATGASLVLSGELSAGGIIASSVVLGRALAPIEMGIGAWKGFVGARGAHRRLKELIADGSHSNDSMPLPVPDGHLACQHLTYAVPNVSEPILRNINFELPAGETLGVIGPSASGKSTLCRLLVGVWEPTRGHIRLDTAELHQYRLEERSKYFGYLPQDVELFTGTIADNIARLQADADPSEIVQAAMLAGVHEMILKMPDGYNTDIGETGSFLSGGQRQRLGLARALFGQPRLIVLDEPNSNLDADGEACLLKAISHAKSWGATVVMVTHLPHILRDAHKVLVLAEGAMVIYGDRDEVFGKIHNRNAEAADQLPPQRKTESGPRAVAQVKG